MTILVSPNQYIFSFITIFNIVFKSISNCFTQQENKLVDLKEKMRDEDWKLVHLTNDFPLHMQDLKWYIYIFLSVKNYYLRKYYIDL